MQEENHKQKQSSGLIQIGKEKAGQRKRGAPKGNRNAAKIQGVSVVERDTQMDVPRTV